MSRLKIFGSIALLVFFSAACIQLITQIRQPSTTYYTLRYDQPDRDDGLRRVGRTIEIGRFQANKELQRENIAYRKAPNEINYYTYRLWANLPENLVRERVIEHFAESQLFRNISTSPRGRSDYLLTGRIHRFEEVDRDDGYYADVMIAVELRDEGSDRVIWNTIAKREVKAEKKKAEAFVEAMIKALREVNEEMLLSVHRQLSRR